MAIAWPMVAVAETLERVDTTLLRDFMMTFSEITEGQCLLLEKGGNGVD